MSPINAVKPPRARLLGLVLALLASPGVARGDSGDVLLIRRGLEVEPVRLVEINDDGLLYRRREAGGPGSSGWLSIDYQDCLAFTMTDLAPQAPETSLLVLSDDQRLPGHVLPNAGDRDALVWSHSKLGQLDVPLTRVRSLVLDRSIGEPPSSDQDVVALSNGDLLEGLVTAIGDTVTIESTEGRAAPIVVPIERVLAVSLVTPARAPSGRRVWLTDHTVLDVQTMRAGDDGYVQLTSSWSVAGTQPTQLELSDLAGALFDTDSLQPLAGLPVSRIEGPASRYVLPEPRRLEEVAPLGLSRLMYRGPIVVRYGLPVGTRRFAAEAVLPSSARRWGDYELRVLDDDREVFATHLSAAEPRATINVELHGSELSIELREGENGPIQDHLVLERAMLLVD